MSQTGWGSGAGAQGGCLAADDEQVVGGGVTAEPGAVVLQERSGRGEVGVVGQHGGLAEGRVPLWALIAVLMLVMIGLVVGLVRKVVKIGGRTGSA